MMSNLVKKYKGKASRIKVPKWLKWIGAIFLLLGIATVVFWEKVKAQYHKIKTPKGAETAGGRTANEKPPLTGGTSQRYNPGYTSRSLGNNNPCAIIKNPANNWLGKTNYPKETFLETFKTEGYGWRAAFVLLLNYASKYNLKTPREIYERWSGAETNFPQFVREHGYDPDVSIYEQAGDVTPIKGLAWAIHLFESGGETGSWNELEWGYANA